MLSILATAGIAWVMIAVVWGLGVAVANLLHRLATGRFFRWFGPWTLGPLAALAIIALGASWFAYRMFGWPT